MEMKRASNLDADDKNNSPKRPKIEKTGYGDHDHHDHDDHDDEVVKFAMPVGFLDPLPPLERQLVNSNIITTTTQYNPTAGKSITSSSTNNNNNGASSSILDIVRVSPLPVAVGGCELRKGRKQFWKAGDYEGGSNGVLSTTSRSVGMDHVRVHPRFLHSNATSHKWALGAFAELLDNALDEVRNGATYVSVDMIINEKESNKMLLADKDRHRMLVIQDDGGGMSPDKMRQCMSLGYSAKSKLANTIGQYGNGFKTSSMRLGADVIVFSVCKEKDGTCATRSIGLLSYTFLTETGKEDIVVPMVDYEQKGQVWTKIPRSSSDDWQINLDTIIEWSPFSSEEELLQQFDAIGNQGTRIVIYNLWEDDEGQLELDFGNDPEDIQLRGVNRNEKKIELTRKYPNSKHFLTYQHSLRSYASILYLRLPPGFRIILRGKDVVHHNLVNDMIHSQTAIYKPVAITDGTVKSSNLLPQDMQASVTIGFVKDAEDHIDIQGFNVYHKNRLIKPFWRVWNAAGSDGRGVIGVLEANFVEPAHDKQGFERTMSLQRLEARLIQMQKNYWRDKCHEIGYAPRRSAVKAASLLASPPNISEISGGFFERTKNYTARKSVKNPDMISISHSKEDEIKNVFESPSTNNQSCSHSNGKVNEVNGKLEESTENQFAGALVKLTKDNFELKTRLAEAIKSRDRTLTELQLEKDKTKSLNALVDKLSIELQLVRDRSSSFEVQLKEARTKIEEMDKEHESLILIFTEERERRNAEEENLKSLSQAASITIEKLLERVKELETMKFPECKPEQT